MLCSTKRDGKGKCLAVYISTLIISKCMIIMFPLWLGVERKSLVDLKISSIDKITINSVNND